MATPNGDKPEREMAGVIRMVIPTKDQAEVARSLAKCGLGAPVLVGYMGEDDLERIIMELAGEEPANVKSGLKKVWNYCGKKVEIARREGRVPVFAKAEAINLNPGGKEEMVGSILPIRSKGGKVQKAAEGEDSSVRLSNNRSRAGKKEELTCTVWAAALRYREGGGMFETAERVGLSEEDTKRAIFEALRARLRADASAMVTARFAHQFADFVENLRREIPKAPLAGPDSHVSIIRFLDHIRPRGHTVPNAARVSLAAWGAAVGCELDTENRGVLYAARGDPSIPRKTSPEMPLCLIRGLERVACDVEYPLARRSFAGGILLMVFASLRYSDAQRIAEIHKNETSVYGRMSCSKTKHGALYPWACPLKGLETNQWIDPVLIMRKELTSTLGHAPGYIFPMVSECWMKIIPAKANCAWFRDRLRGMALALGVKEEHVPTLHSMKSWSNTMAAQLGFDNEERCLLGHWVQGSSMPRLYDKSHCVADLRARASIINKINEGWEPVQSYEVPNVTPPREGVVSSSSPPQPAGASGCAQAVGSDDESELASLFSSPVLRKRRRGPGAEPREKRRQK